MRERGAPLCLPPTPNPSCCASSSSLSCAGMEGRNGWKGEGEGPGGRVGCSSCACAACGWAEFGAATAEGGGETTEAGWDASKEEFASWRWDLNEQNEEMRKSFR